MASEKQILRKITEDPNYFKEIPKNHQNEKICLKAVSYDWTLLELVENQTDAIIIKAMSGNYEAFKYVRNQTLNVCLAAVKKNYNTIQFITNKSIEIYQELFKKGNTCEKAFKLIKDPSKEIIIEFIKACPNALNKKYIKDHTIEFYNIAVKHQGMSIKYIKNPTPEMCLEAVKQDFNAFKYIKNQTEEICLIAVKCYSQKNYKNYERFFKDKDFVIGWFQFGNIHELQYHPIYHNLSEVLIQTDSICLEAVKYYGFSLRYVKNQTKEICLAAVSNIGYAIAYIKKENQTKDICLAAVNNAGFAIRYIHKDNISEEIALVAVKQNGLVLNYIINKTHEICYDAINQNGLALKYVPKDMLNEDMYLDAVKQNGLALEFINEEDQNEDICNEALKKNIDAIKFVKKNIDYDLALKAIRKDVMNLQYIPHAHVDIINEAFNKDHNVIKYIKNYNQTEEMCLKAIQHDIDLIQYVNFKIPNDLAIKAVTKNGIYLKNIINQTDEIVKIALEQNINAFKYVKNYTPNMCLDIVKKDGMQLEYIKIQICKIEWKDYIDQIYMEAIKQNPLAIKFAFRQTLEHRNEAIKNNPEYARYFIFTASDCTLEKNFENDDVCPICLDKNNEIDNRIISVKACKHNYHLKCLLDFHKHSADRKCCKCRKNLFEHT
jgi:hypothetical protein